MSDDTLDEKRPKPKHPRLTKRQDAAQRGEDPADAIAAPQPPEFPDEDPNWQPDPHVTDPWKGIIGEHGREHRPNREDVLPYLLIRGFAPGDRAVRPMWPPQPSWLSPDILLIDASWPGAFRADKVVANPIAGRTYRVFVHVWNLGLFPAVGVHLRAWHVAPGFFGGTPGAFTPELIGGTFVDLAPRTAPGAHKVREMQPPWPIAANLTGHECLLAAADCAADRWNGVLDANADRHVGQRNLTILAGSQDLEPLLKLLTVMLPDRALLEVTLQSGEGKSELRYGVPIASGRHLFVGMGRNDRLVLLPTTQLAEILGEQRPDLSQAGTAASLFSRWARRFGDRLETTSLDAALGNLLDVPDLSAKTVASALGGLTTATLHLAAFDPEKRPSGGYSIAIAGAARRKR